VLHDGGQDVAATTAQLVPQLLQQGYQFATVILYGGMDLYKLLIYSYPSCQSPEFTTMASGRSPEFVKLN